MHDGPNKISIYGGVRYMACKKLLPGESDRRFFGLVALEMAGERYIFVAVRLVDMHIIRRGWYSYVLIIIVTRVATGLLMAQLSMYILNCYGTGQLPTPC